MKSQYLITIALLATASLSFAGHPKMARDLKGSGEMVDVIVQFTAAPTSRHHDKVRRRGGLFRADLGVAKAGLYTVPAGALEDLANDPEVAYITPNREVGASSFEYGVPVTNAPSAWAGGWNGKGIGVAVIDSGMDSKSNDIPGGRIVYSESFVTGDTSTSDAYGHGTHRGNHRR